MSYSKQIHVLVFNGFICHGTSRVLQMLRALDRYHLVVSSFEKGAIHAASGLRILPDIDSEAIDLAAARLCLLPDGALWMRPARRAGDDRVSACVSDMLQSFAEAGVIIAAMGDAVLALARAGLLDGINHTGPAVERLAQQAPGYRPTRFHVGAPAVIDQAIVTARADSPIEFANAVLTSLDTPDLECPRVPCHAAISRAFAA